MTTWVILIILSICVVEVFSRVEILSILKRIKFSFIKSIHTIASSLISDHWKEIVLPAYALDIFIQSTKILLILLFVSALLLLGDLFVPGLINLFISLDGIIVSVMTVTFYGVIRTNFM